MVTNWAKGRVVVGYVRSSYEGDDACCSVALQNTAIEQCVAEAGGLVLDWYVDEGYARDMIDRPPLRPLLATAQ